MASLDSRAASAAWVSEPSTASVFARTSSCRRWTRVRSTWRCPLSFARSPVSRCSSFFASALSFSVLEKTTNSASICGIRARSVSMSRSIFLSSCSSFLRSAMRASRSASRRCCVAAAVSICSS
eukprot:Amastigsp_a341841_14.p3 type:complete len:124 gc:universal Amastigsp_a341841_14:95-466(+)